MALSFPFSSLGPDEHENTRTAASPTLERHRDGPGHGSRSAGTPTAIPPVWNRGFSEANPSPLLKRARARGSDGKAGFKSGF